MQTIFKSVFSNLSDVIQSEKCFKYNTTYSIICTPQDNIKRNLYFKENSWDDFVIAFDVICQEQNWDNVVVNELKAK